MTRFEAIAIACNALLALGFVESGKSGLSESVYFRRPGRRMDLRVAAHDCRRSHNEIGAQLLFRDDQGGYGAYVGNIDAEEVAELVAEVAAEYDATEEEADEMSDEELEALVTAQLAARAL